MSTSARPSREQRFARRLRFLAPADPPAETGLVAGGEGEVVDRVDHPDEAEVLVHEADAGIVRGRPVAERERLAVDPCLASPGSGWW